MALGIRLIGRRQFMTCLVLAGIGAGLAGCGGDSSGISKAKDQATISGSLTNNGKAVAVDTQVVFESGEKSAMAMGKVDALGKFTLKPGDPALGIPAGRYTVTITPPSPPPEPVGSDAYKAKMMQGGGNMTAVRKPSDIPDQFQSALTTPLKLEVKTGANDFPIDLAKIGQ